MSKNFLTRQKAEKPVTIRTRAGALKVIEPSDVTVSQLADGTYRCFRCPRALAGDWTTPDAGRMLLHAVDHLVDGRRVPAAGLHELAAEALRR